MRGRGIFALGLGLAAVTAMPQQDRRITIDVAAADKSGHDVGGLQQQDFTILDNKAAQKIVSFRAVTGAATAAADLPVQVIILLDEVNASFRGVANARQQMQKFFKANGAELARPVSLVFFSDKGTTIGSAPSEDGKVLLTELQQHENGLRTINRAQGFYGAGDQLNLSLRTLGELANYETTRRPSTLPGRKLVVWISPGWPLLSGPNVQLTSKEQQEFFTSIVGLSDALRRADITLYAVDPLGTSDAGGFRTFYYEQFLKGVKTPNKVQIGNLALQVLAAQSGGLVLNSSNDVAGEIARCISDARTFYVLSFEAAAGDGPNDYHELEVKVDKPGVTARTRTGYYGQANAR